MKPLRLAAWAVVCLAAARPAAAQPTIALAPYATGLSSPIGISAPADGSGRLFIVQQAGLIRIHGFSFDSPLEPRR